MKRTTLLLFLLTALTVTGWGKQVIRVACVGNSVTYGSGLADRKTQAYPVRLQQMLGDRYEVSNFGHPGATLLRRGHKPYMRLPEFREALKFKADWVVIHLGLNDTDPRNWPNYGSEFIRDYRTLIDSFRVSNPNARIWICLMTPIGDRHPRFQSGTRDWFAAIQQCIRRIAATTNVGLINLNAPLYNRPDLFPDALHPNAEGAEIMARTIYSNLTGNFGGLQLSPLYTDGMVIQRERPICFNGQANAGTVVKVQFDKQEQAIKVSPDGKWCVTFPQKAAGGPYSIMISAGKQQRIIRDVWVGDVWLCSGQSNMEFTLARCATVDEDIKSADRHPKLHLFNMSTHYPTDAVVWDSVTLTNINSLRLLNKGPWQRCNAQDARKFSAVAYHFGRVLADSLQIPIGLICNAVGGTTTEAWIDRSTLEWQFPAILNDWYHGDYGQQWARNRALLNIKNTKNRLQRHPYQPAYMFESGILPLDHYAVKGVIWYQGESNAHNAELHSRLFPMLEASWRAYFRDSRLPFYFVQLSRLNRPSWPAFRESQRQLGLKLRDTWMTVTSDLGDSLNVHYRHKRPVGERLALQALRHSYRHAVVSEGPVLRNVVNDGVKLILSFDNAVGLRAKDGVLRGFEVAGTEGLYVPAEARIVGNQVEISSDRVSHPCAVRYGWQPFTRANLVNEKDLPASTFTEEIVPYPSSLP